MTWQKKHDWNFVSFWSKIFLVLPATFQYFYMKQNFTGKLFNQETELACINIHGQTQTSEELMRNVPRTIKMSYRVPITQTRKL